MIDEPQEQAQRERRPSVNEGEVPDDFFNQGQQLQQVPRATMVNIDNSEVKRKVFKSVIVHLVLEGILLTGLISSASVCDDYSELRRIERSQISMCVLLIYAPAIMLRIYMLTSKPRLYMRAQRYRNLYIISGYHQLIASAIWVMLSWWVFEFNMTDIAIDSECFALQFFIFFLTFEYSVMALYAIVGSCEMIAFCCKGCNNDTNATRNLQKISRAFDPFKFSDHTECTICLVEFSDADMVTALPCDVRHYFHTECIQEWSRTQNTCPLCKAVFNERELREFNAKLTIEVDKMKEKEEMMAKESAVEPNGNEEPKDGSQQLLIEPEERK